jgi:hypothetical protein
LIKRYTPFIQYDKNKFLHILKKKIRETAWTSQKLIR